MGKLSVYAVDKIFDHIFKVAEFVQPTVTWIALFDGDPEGIGVECPGVTYGRIQCTAWVAGALRANSNSDLITFLEAGIDWGVANYVAIMDAEVAGNVLGKDDITEITINEGDDLYIDIGDIDVSWAAGGICNTWAAKTLDHIFKNTPITVPTNIYVGYSTADPTDDASGLAEPVANGYARKLMNTWNIAAAKLTDNDGAILFDACVTAPQGTITHFIISDHLTNVLEPNIIIHGALDAPVNIGVGDQLNFPDETLEIEVDSGV